MPSKINIFDNQTASDSAFLTYLYAQTLLGDSKMLDNVSQIDVETLTNSYWAKKISSFMMPTC